MKKKMIIASCFGIAILLLAQSFAPAPPPQNEYKELISNYDQQPPIAKHYWIQKLQDTLNDGSNIIMRIEYVDEGKAMPNHLSIFSGEDEYIDFKDDGTFPDLVQNDRIYAAYLKENIPSLLITIQNNQDILLNRNKITKYNGHVAHEIDVPEELIKFDFEAFSSNESVEIDPLVNNVIDCNTDILKQNSLFITDLSVVEDNVRTFNFINNTGNPIGAWTFGTLMKGIANDQIGNETKKMIKYWLKRWTDTHTINGQSITKREGALKFLILPWITKARNWPMSHYEFNLASFNSNANNWEADWDATSAESLLKYAPFKLTAIVNRLDLLANTAYSANIKNAGETRFVFTLINLYSYSNSVEGGTQIAGMPPKGFNGVDPQLGQGIDCQELLDWSGMNVIIEYGNPMIKPCDIQNFAREWQNLSTLQLRSVAYRDALQHITDQVTRPNSAPNKTNGSALNQIRTNERIFAISQCAFQTGGVALWENSDWELSQFKLSPITKYLVPVPVSNTPWNFSNSPYLQLNTPGNGGTTNLQTLQGSVALTDWAMLNIDRVYLGNHELPSSYSISSLTDVFKLAGTALVDAEKMHFWDLNWGYVPPNITNNYSGTILQDVRHQLSLNTCQGCHSGETKTIFTMVRPVGFGQSANYWGDVPNGTDGNFEVDYGRIDSRFVSTNGRSNINGTIEPTNTMSNAPQNLQRVSAFLTGRNYSGAGNWEDDNLTDSNDNNLNGNFWIYDPIDYYEVNIDKTEPGKDRLLKFNDLHRRKEFLCKLLSTPCKGGYYVLKVMNTTSFQPLPLGGH